MKKGKTRPPRLVELKEKIHLLRLHTCLSGFDITFFFLFSSPQIHLESSITRHKAHIMKLELILRLLDNDELSPEQVNDVKDFLDDYVERNQVLFYENFILFCFLIPSSSFWGVKRICRFSSKSFILTK